LYSFLFSMNYPDSKLSEIQIAVKRRDLDFVQLFMSQTRRFTSNGFLYTPGHSGITRRVMYAACLFDDVEVAEMCMNTGWVYDYYTIITALHEGATKVADFLYEKARDQDLNKYVRSFLVFGGCSSSVKKCTTARWLIAHGYKFGHSDLRHLAICDEFDVFNIMFDSMTCAPMCVPRYKEMFDDCIRNGAFRVAQFFECVMGFDAKQVCAEKEMLEVYKDRCAKRGHAAIVIQMKWQNYRRRKDPSIALKEAAESWDKLVAEFPEKFNL